ncbi:MAG: GNAT family N-acetyltransferase, partial [Flavobacterium sp.]
MIIRKSCKSDMSSVLELIKELATFELEPDAVIITEEDLIRDGFGENPLFYCFVAELNKNIIGMALYYYRYSTWKGKTIHLEDLIVKQSYRGTGAGSLLYQKVLEQGQIENVQRMEWSVLNWN